MNQNFSTHFLEEIREKLSNINGDSFDIVSFNQVVDGNQSINQKDIAKYLYSDLVILHSKTMLSQFLTVCHDHGWVILPIGNGTKIHWGKLPSHYDIMVSTRKINSIIDHAVEDLTVTVESGMKIKDLQSFLALKGQFLPIDPFFPESATIGGIVATANTGSWRQRYGGVRDLILGISFLRGDGKEAKAGGRVVKNVAGYDLMKLFTGSYGNLGIITDVTFRTFPLPENSLTLVITGNQESIYQLQKTVSSSSLTPTAADLLSSSLIKSFQLGEGLGLIFRFQGITESVKQQTSQIQTWSKELNLSILTYQNQSETTLWQNLPQKTYLTDFDNPITCKVGILPSEAVNLMSAFDGYGVINISSGIGNLSLKKGIKIHQINNLRQFCENRGGFLTILDAPISIKTQIEPWGYVGNSLQMMKNIKQKFDPKNIFCHRL
ncbi:MAG: FAD-binding oxidoreductase [Cyanobacteria bacterium]|nr:FAD-binding oxidoreductase [Cyanobacteria bacterium CG_2015-16_32_12]NCO77644.1 FAD-binding oxidoreductase [Cyanobacteria bacterium CG_2015-22_32_23]NCQ04300.1 FAD-binding oxidoreductase [Cyanobacteria bacterium CG_2015-09_32_10]NCQ42945.1 FAD-binding oxidoreductase [Cyanobacteria bacterium CG_2015-04_32_10]NCS84533.1 FAD-binding oxidoreductase [Cyanobacteria bacterium CG_2015-02_32_10]